MLSEKSNGENETHCERATIMHNTASENRLLISACTVLLSAHDRPEGDRSISNYRFLVISIVVDADRGHCWEHLKKVNLR